MAGGKRETDRIANSNDNVHILEKKKSKPSIDQVKAKIGKESISAGELAVYLSSLRGMQENDCLDEKTIRRYIGKLCRLSGGLLKINDFKTGNNNAYEFKPKYHDLLIALLDTDYFGGNKNDKNIEDRIELQGQLTRNIDKYVKGKDQKKLQSDPSYLNANLEAKLLPLITNELVCMLNTMYNAESCIRYQYMLECLERLVGIRRWMNEWDERIKIIRRTFAQNDPNDVELADKEEGLFKSDGMEMLMIKVLSARMKGEDYQYVSDDEELSYPATYLSTKQYDISVYKKHKLYSWFAEVESRVSNSWRYQFIMMRLREVLDEGDLLERKILDSLDKIVRAEIVAECSSVTPYDYKRMIRFIEESLREDKKKIHDICDDKVDVKLENEVLKEIMAIKDREERKKNVAGQRTLE